MLVKEKLVGLSSSLASKGSRFKSGSRNQFPLESWQPRCNVSNAK